MLLLPLLFVCVYAVYSASPLKILSGCIRMTDREQGERGNQRPFSGGLGVRTVRCGTRHHCPCSTILSRSSLGAFWLVLLLWQRSKLLLHQGRPPFVFPSSCKRLQRKYVEGAVSKSTKQKGHRICTRTGTLKQASCNNYQCHIVGYL
jgi:hypothetical protein